MTSSLSSLGLVAAFAVAACRHPGAAPVEPAPPPPDAPLVHVQAECTFELRPPEPLSVSATEQTSTKYAGEALWFQAFSGASLQGLDGLVFFLRWGDPAPPLYAATVDGVHLAVVANRASSVPERGVVGMGEEAATDGRPLGCAFLCGGTREREADVLALCKSVRIRYEASEAD